MRRRLSRRAPVVALALAAPLILSTGQAADPAAAGEAQGAERAVCRAVPASNAQWDIDQQFNRLVASGETVGAPDVVVLNTQGYNYGPRTDEQLRRLGLEALQLEAELRKR